MKHNKKLLPTTSMDQNKYIGSTIVRTYRNYWQIKIPFMQNEQTNELMDSTCKVIESFTVIHYIDINNSCYDVFTQLYIKLYCIIKLQGKIHGKSNISTLDCIDTHFKTGLCTHGLCCNK